MPQEQKNQTTIDHEDVRRFESQADQWWNPHGSMKPLHLFTPIRLDYILTAARRAGLTQPEAASHSGPEFKAVLEDLSVLDVGCGGGLLAEPLCRLGAKMTAIDASAGAIKAAKNHADGQGLVIDYRHMAVEDLAGQSRKAGSFDLVYASEIIEHVTDRHKFLVAIAELLKPDGVVVFTTISKTLPALMLAKFAAEYVLNLVPRGTHEFAKFITPTRLQQECAHAGILIDDITGFVPTPTGGFRFSSITAINYGASGQRAL